MHARRQKVRFPKTTTLGTLALTALSIGFSTTPCNEAAAESSRSSEKDVRNATVFERPRDHYDPIGIPVGSFRFWPRLDLSESYDDNIFAVNANKKSDFETLIEPSARLTSEWSRHSFLVEAGGHFHRFMDLKTENNTEFDSTAALHLDLGRGAEANAKTSYQRLTVARSDPEESGGIRPEQMDVFNTELSWSQPFGHFKPSVTAAFSDQKERESINSDKDRRYFIGKFRLSYVASPAINAFVEPTYTVTDFKQSSDRFGFNRDSNEFAVNFGVAYDITGILYGETSAGFYSVNFADTRFKDDSSFRISSKTTWSISPVASLIANVSRSSIVTNTVGSSNRVETGGSLTFQYELLRNLLLDGTASVARDKFNEIQRNDTTIGFKAGAQLFLNNNVALVAKYDFLRRTSSIPEAEFTENRVMIGIRGQF